MATLVPLLVLSHLATAVASLPMIARRVPPNRTYGFRVPATLADERVWYDANAAAGRWILLATVASALFAVVYLRGHSEPLAPAAALEFFTAALLAAVVLSFVSLRRIVR